MTIRKIKRAMTFGEYQRQVEVTDESKKPLRSLLGLVGEIGDLHTIFKRLMGQKQYPTFASDLAEEIGDILWYVSSVASRYDLSLDEIAKKNLTKANKFFSDDGHLVLDGRYPDDERFPRQFEVIFEEKSLGKAVQVKIKLNGVFIGDALTDNAHRDDGYRYHDAFHLAYAAILGWSPVTRSLLHRKRKSNRIVDEVEDGARAIIVEEAVSIFIFNQAAGHGFYRDPTAVDISLLKTVQNLCSNLEVKKCSAKRWQQAIFKGYEIFNALIENQGGCVTLDLDRKEISFARLETGLRAENSDEKRSRAELSNRMEKRLTANSGQPRGTAASRH